MCFQNVICIIISQKEGSMGSYGKTLCPDLSLVSRLITTVKEYRCLGIIWMQEYLVHKLSLHILKVVCIASNKNCTGIGGGGGGSLNLCWQIQLSFLQDPKLWDCVKGNIAKNGYCAPQCAKWKKKVKDVLNNLK